VVIHSFRTNPVPAGNGIGLTRAEILLDINDQEGVTLLQLVCHGQFLRSTDQSGDG
jgi:hypothetical protein